MMSLFYLIGIYSYGVAISIASLFSEKAKKWIQGRKDFWQHLPPQPINRVIWFHAASLGEFEQGRPIIEAWKNRHPTDYILLTFFSPSGYEQKKHYEHADFVCYLPIDTTRNAKKFIKHFNPQQCFFIKYEFWLNYINEAHKNNSKLYAISAVFRPQQRFFKWYGGIFRTALKKFDHIFVQNNESLALLKEIQLTNVSVAGDTRYDRAFDRQQNHQRITVIEEWLGQEKAFIVGSSWSEDEALLLPLINDGTITQKTIIAPHEVDKHHIKSIQNQLTVPFQCYTAIQQGEKLNPTTQVVLIDCIGILADVYQYGAYAYIGGAFRTGLHNILEPATFGLPVIFGPNHKKFPEAQDFINAGIGWSVGNEATLKKTLLKLNLKNSKLKEIIKAFMEGKTGARKIILEKTSIK